MIRACSRAGAARLRDGFIAVLLPAYLLALGLGQLEVGFISTATLFGSALATLRWGAGGTASPSAGCCSHLAPHGGDGAGLRGPLFAVALLLVAFVGTLNRAAET